MPTLSSECDTADNSTSKRRRATSSSSSSVESDADFEPASKRQRARSESPPVDGYVEEKEYESPPPEPSNAADDEDEQTDAESDEEDEDDDDDDVWTVCEDGDPQFESRLLQLPLEIIDLILDELQDGSYKRAKAVRPIAATCRLARLYWRDILVDDVVGSFHCDCGGDRRIFFLRNAKPGQFGWKPFLIWHAERFDEYTEEDEDVPDAFLFCHEFDPERFEEKTPADESIWIRSSFVEVYISASYWDAMNAVRPSGHHKDDFINDDARSWKFDILPKGLMVADLDTYRERFSCPECDDSREILYGSSYVAKRWPEIVALPAHLQYAAGCPRCEWGDAGAYRHHREVIQEFEDAEW